MTNTTKTRRPTSPTLIITARSMAETVQGHRPRTPRFRGVVALALGLLACAAGCHATAPAPEPETVGQLARSYNSVASAPVHASTDFGGVRVVETDDGGGEAKVSHGEAVEAPEVATKNAHGF